MKIGKGTRAAALVLSMLALLCFAGCDGDEPEEPEPVDGGRTFRTDPDAPKTITSKDIAEYEASFVVSTRWSGDEEHAFLFRVAADESGALVATEKNSGVSAPADEALLTSLQGIIDANDLARLNGVYDVTAGLAPEYWPGGMTVRYASGETLTFTTDNNPYALWAEQTYDAFAEWFAARGDERLYPTPEESPVTRIRLWCTENGRRYRYGGVYVSGFTEDEEKTYLLEREISDEVTWETIEDGLIPFPEDYYARVTEIVAGTDVVRRYDFSRLDRQTMNYGNHDNGYYGMGALTTADGEEDAEGLSVSLHIEFESGRRVYIDTKKPSEIEALRPLIMELAMYHETLF